MAGEAVAVLREAIIIGELPPGAPLRLEELAESLGMSISPIREAIRHLETVGLAEHVAYRGARVTALTAADMRDVYEVRTALEVLAVRRAAERFTDGDRVRVEVVLEVLEAAYRRGDHRGIVDGNTAFHTLLAAISESRWLQRLLQPAFETTERYGAAVLRLGRPEETKEIESSGHAAILAACVARDPDAAEAAVREHLQVFRATFEQASAVPSPRRPSGSRVAAAGGTLGAGRVRPYGTEPSACRMRVGVSGSSVSSTPIASATAFVTAGGAPIAPPSPTPRKPIGATGGLSRWTISIDGTSVAVGSR